MAPRRLDDTDAVRTQLALKKINAFSGVGHGFYFWNFRTELDEPDWSYMLALERGWIPKGNLNADIISNACIKEDEGLFLCICKRDQLESSVRGAVAYCLNDDGVKDQSYLDNLEGEDLYEEADRAFNKFWNKHRVEGATCDFGGLAMLSEVNATDTEGYDDDYYYYYGGGENTTVTVLKIVGATLGGLLVGGLIGFFFAMRFNKKFNARVSRALSRTDIGRGLRSSKAFSAAFHPSDFGYDDIKDAEPNAWAELNTAAIKT